MTKQEKVKDFINKAIELSDVTQYRLALDAKMHPQTVYKVLSNTADIKIGMAEKILAQLGYDIEISIVSNATNKRTVIK
ncbi:MAG: helix-turn-helix domain-containing protein [Hyphomicrobiales bacterium]